MKRFLVAMLVVFGSVQAAYATSLTISDGLTTATVNGTGTVSYSNANFDGWNLKVALGDSNSSSLTPYGLDLVSLAASCAGGTGCATHNLIISLSDVNFKQVPVGGFLSSFSGNIVSGSASQSAWFDTTNTLFGQGTLIGTLGPFSGPSFSATIAGGSAGPNPYSLTLTQTITAGSQGVSLDGMVGSVPEPMSLLLLGFGLVGTGLLGMRARVSPY